MRQHRALRFFIIVLIFFGAHSAPCQTVVKTSDLSFGSFIPGTAPGSIQVHANSTITSSNVALMGGTVSAAQFTFQGPANTSVTLTLPADGVLTDGAHSIPIAFSAANVSGGSLNFTTNGSGNATINLGATLSPAANQLSGDYSAVFTLFMDY
jgi:hypothetical protein